MISWLQSWAVTLRIMLFERHTYRFLTSLEGFDPDDFVDAERPS